MAEQAPDTTPQPAARRATRRRRRWLLWVSSLFVLLLGAAIASAFWMKGREVVAPAWLRDRIALELAQALPDVQLTIGDVVAVVDEDWRPRFSVRNLDLRTPDGVEILSVSNVRAGLDAAALLERRVQLDQLDASGVLVTMQRAANGAISLRAGGNTSALRRQAPSLVQLVSELDEFLLRPAFNDLRRVDLRAITLRFEDLRAARAWTIDGGRMRLDREGNDLQIAMDLAALGGASGVATVSANYAGTIGETAADFGVTFANLDARDVATQGPEFAWLRALEAPISGALRGGLRSDGRFDPLNATLQIGAGNIQPTPQARPIPIEGVRSYFSYLPDEKLLRFDELSVDSAWGRGRLEGQAVLGNIEGVQLEDLVGQFRLTGLEINPDGVYPDPVHFASAELDFRLTSAPFALEIGRFQLSDQGQLLTAQGRVSAGSEGWDVALDGQLDGLAAARLVALWPERVKPKTRNWIAENVREGQVRDATGALRILQGGEPRTSLGFDFEGARFTFADSMPEVENARGHGSLVDNRFVLVLDEGGLTAPEGGFVDGAGTAFIVPDTKAKPDPPGIVRLVADGAVTAAFSLLDRPPLEVMRKANIPVTVAEGQVQVAGTISLPLKKKAPVEEVSFDVAGTVTDARSTVLLQNRKIAAPLLALTASEDLVEVRGRGTLDGVPLEAVWRQQLGRPGDVLPGRVEGEVALTPEALDAFGIDLPDGSIAGRAGVAITLDLLKGTPPQLALRSDLVGLRLSLPPVVWSKAPDRPGRLEVDMTLGPAPAVDRLLLEAPGISATGDVSLTPDAQLERVRFDRLRIGSWLDAPVDLVGRGRGLPVGVVLRGGTVDLRAVEFPSGGQSGQPSGPLSVTLDQLQVSDTISLTGMRGDFETSGGLAGSFTGQVNNGTAISGQLLPRNGRSAIRLRAQDAGGVAASAGMTRQAQGGQLDLSLVPVGTGGAFDGNLRMTDIRVTEAPTMAELLNAISVVGLINELNGDGIYFSEITADFRLAPDRITVREAAAVGASMGLSMDGVFEPGSGRLQLQGVISPIYLLNAVGSVLTRPGEGLFGFNYSISGTTRDPQVFVNPLTVLAPGMLRNLFRRGEPDVPLEEGESAPVEAPRRTPLVTRGEDR